MLYSFLTYIDFIYLQKIEISYMVNQSNTKMNRTLEEYNQVTERAKSLFLKKAKDYGTSWRILRPSSITDQIFIKASRIRSIEQKGAHQVNEGIDSEFIGILNYAIIALIQIQMKDDGKIDMLLEDVHSSYDQKLQEARTLMLAKNHDYGEAWRDIRLSSITDLILMKIFRIKQIEDNKGELLASEGLEANYLDMINYAAFALIRLNSMTK